MFKVPPHLLDQPLRLHAIEREQGYSGLMSVLAPNRFETLQEEMSLVW